MAEVTSTDFSLIGGVTANTVNSLTLAGMAPNAALDVSALANVFTTISLAEDSAFATAVSSAVSAGASLSLVNVLTLAEEDEPSTIAFLGNYGAAQSELLTLINDDTERTTIGYFNAATNAPAMAHFELLTRNLFAQGDISLNDANWVLAGALPRITNESGVAAHLRDNDLAPLTYEQQFGSVGVHPEDAEYRAPMTTAEIASHYGVTEEHLELFWRTQELRGAMSRTAEAPQSDVINSAAERAQFTQDISDILSRPSLVVRGHNLEGGDALTQKRLNNEGVRVGNAVYGNLFGTSEQIEAYETRNFPISLYEHAIGTTKREDAFDPEAKKAYVDQVDDLREAAGLTRMGPGVTYAALIAGAEEVYDYVDPDGSPEKVNMDFPNFSLDDLPTDETPSDDTDEADAAAAAKAKEEAERLAQEEADRIAAEEAAAAEAAKAAEEAAAKAAQEEADRLAAEEAERAEAEAQKALEEKLAEEAARKAAEEAEAAQKAADDKAAAEYEARNKGLSDSEKDKIDATLNGTVEDLRVLLESGTSDAWLDYILASERAGKGRVTAVDLILSREKTVLSSD